MVRGCVSLEKRQVRRPMLMFGVMVLAVTDRRRPEEFWCAALGYEVHTDGFGGSAGVLIPPIGTGTMIALQTSEMPPKAPQQPTTLTGGGGGGGS
jgi:hypothetical protein